MHFPTKWRQWRAGAGRLWQVISAAALVSLVLPSCTLFTTVSTTGAQITQFYDGPGGATCEFFYAGGGQKWQRKLGDWVDAEGKLHGDAPFAQNLINATDSRQQVQWDITRVVRDWSAGEHPNYGLLLRPVEGQGTTRFASSEAEDPSARPVLTLEYENGEKERVSPAADTVLDCSSVHSLGESHTLSVGRSNHTLLHFELPPRGDRELTRAVLWLTAIGGQGGERVGVFRLQPPVGAPSAEVQYGLAAKYPNDRGIDKDPNVILFAGFEQPEWKTQWSYVTNSSLIEIVDRDEPLTFQPLRGKALRVALTPKQNLGLNMGYKFREALGQEPEEIYFRYYLRFANDWSPVYDGGKLPGISGTYNKAGWGGRRSNGKNGWSMRSTFVRWTARDDPLKGRTQVGTYAYHANMRGTYGDRWDWSIGDRGLLANNRWYSIEQYLKINTPGRNDGVLRVWVDGLLAFEQSGIRVRDIPELKIDQIWMDVYHGGTRRSGHPQHLYIDNVVIADRYIGPMMPR
jgi:hypothetical protein